ncbi:uncharacterized protein LOC129590735 [Paramacrobiotus metropolitanus]|uniref:uncharacterized protein LOC129590735 n=1 Tax=Paramacrobiotus metropolitanus TaxID=2943436 RepID=UPI002445FD6E|nr:uncharacterized protein LOC129590735 [Paramacrobiotus metropolitanus]
MDSGEPDGLAYHSGVRECRVIHRKLDSADPGRSLMQIFYDEWQLHQRAGIDSVFTKVVIVGDDGPKLRFTHEEIYSDPAFIKYQQSGKFVYSERVLKDKKEPNGLRVMLNSKIKRLDPNKPWADVVKSQDDLYAKLKTGSHTERKADAESRENSAFRASAPAEMVQCLDLMRVAEKGDLPFIYGHNGVDSIPMVKPFPIPCIFKESSRVDGYDEDMDGITTWGVYHSTARSATGCHTEDFRFGSYNIVLQADEPKWWIAMYAHDQSKVEKVVSGWYVKGLISSASKSKTDSRQSKDDQPKDDDVPCNQLITGHYHRMAIPTDPDKLLDQDIALLWASQGPGEIMMVSSNVVHYVFQAGGNVCMAINFADIHMVPKMVLFTGIYEQCPHDLDDTRKAEKDVKRHRKARSHGIESHYTGRRMIAYLKTMEAEHGG